jgi:hypothetical protein
MLEEALPVAAGVGIALLTGLAYGGISACTKFAILGAEDSGFFKALEDGKTEDEALAIATGAAAPAPAAPATAAASAAERYSRLSAVSLAAGAAGAAAGDLARGAINVVAAPSPSWGFAARGLAQRQ